MKKISMIIFGLLILTVPKTFSQEFFDTSDAEKFFTFSARLGLNTSNRTVPTSNTTYYNHESWGTGFNAGILANLNFKEYLTLQPGIFYESRSGNFAYASDYADFFNPLDTQYVLGHWRAYYFTIPVMGIVKFNIASNVQASAEFGPYIQFQLKESGKGVDYFEYLPMQGQYTHFMAEQNKVDVGFKMGVGLKFYRHYYVGVHYLAGVCHAWKNPSGGKNKSWLFSIGYDF